MTKPYSFLAIYQIGYEPLKRREIIIAGNVETAWDVIREKLKDIVVTGMNVQRLRPRDYLGIRYWGNTLHSGFDYIQTQQDRAFENSAPLSALTPNWDKVAYTVNYKDWACACDAIPNKQIAVDYKAFLAERGFLS